MLHLSFLTIKEFFKIITLTAQVAEQILLSYHELPDKIELQTNPGDNENERMDVATVLLREEGCCFSVTFTEKQKL